MQSDLLGAHAMGVRNLLLVTGDPPTRRRLSRRDGGLRRRLDRPDQRRGAAEPRARHRRPADRPADGVSHRRRRRIPRRSNLDEEIRRFEYKVEAGAEFAVTQPVFDLGGVRRRSSSGSSASRIPIVAGIMPFESLRHAEFMANEVPGVSVPGRDHRAHAPAPTRRGAPREGLAIAREIARRAAAAACRVFSLDVDGSDRRPRSGSLKRSSL